MLTPQLMLGIAPKLVVDIFAGAGGWSTAYEQATGQHLHIAISDTHTHCGDCPHVGARCPDGLCTRDLALAFDAVAREGRRSQAAEGLNSRGSRAQP